ncbi:unnamed protein product [Closterium sp. Naga37s-1]|nr:unnamed protein product [Closterium sp. Naga37s-1]
MAAVRTAREKLPQLMHLAVGLKDTFNFDETALYLSVLSRKTFGKGRTAGRKVAKARLTVGFLHVEGGNVGNGTAAGNVDDIGLDAEVHDVGVLIDRLCLGSGAMAVEEFVAIDDTTCAEPGEDPLATEPQVAPAGDMWEALATMQAVYDDTNPTCREARRTARAACEMLIGYARATCITLGDLCVLFDIRNPIIIARMERASPPLDLNMTPPPAMTHEGTPPAETPRRRGRVLPAWMTVPTPDWVAQSAFRQELIDAGVCRYERLFGRR